jgi:DNA-binding NarL/FixJ family response regulator
LLEYHRYFAFASAQVAAAPKAVLSRVREQFGHAFSRLAPTADVGRRDGLVWRLPPTTKKAECPSYGRSVRLALCGADLATAASTVLNFCPKMSAAKARTKSTLSASDFIRAQPATMSVVEVLAKAKAAGLKFSRQLAYVVRSKKPTGRPRGRPLDPDSKAGFTRRMQSMTVSENEPHARATGLSCLAFAALRLGTVEKQEGIAERIFAQLEPRLALRLVTAMPGETGIRAAARTVGLRVSRFLSTATANDLVRQDRGLWIARLLSKFDDPKGIAASYESLHYVLVIDVKKDRVMLFDPHPWRREPLCTMRTADFEAAWTAGGWHGKPKWARLLHPLPVSAPLLANAPRLPPPQLGQPADLRIREVGRGGHEIVVSFSLGRLTPLTPAELEVARLAHTGYSNTDIARVRRASRNTVARQMHVILSKLHLRSRLDLATIPELFVGSPPNTRKNVHRGSPLLSAIGPEVEGREVTRIWREIASGHWATLAGADVDGARHASMKRHPVKPVDWRVLSTLQRDLLTLKAEGLSQQVIAMKLGMPASTVSGVLAKAHKRLGFPSLGQLLRAYCAAMALPGRPPDPKSGAAFVRSLPRTMPAAEVIEKGKAVGMKLSAEYVYTARARSSTVTPKPPTKSDFIRSQPAGLSTPEIVAMGKAAGIKFTPQLANKVKRAAATSPAAKTDMSAGGSTVSASSAENLLRAVAAEIGLGRAIELLHGERARAHSLLRE